MPKIRFTDARIRSLKLPPGKSQQDFFETVIEGRSLILTLNKTGRHAWSVMFYRSGKAKRKKIGWYGYADAAYSDLSPKEARKAAIDFDVQAFLATGKAGSFKDVAEKWFRRHVVENNLRSAFEMRRHLEKYLYPKLGSRPFTEIKRLEINDLLHAIVEASRQRGRSGKSQADAVLATIRSIMSWYQTQDDDYSSPIVRGMRLDKRKPDQKTRKRILDDEEIRSVWSALGEMSGSFPSILKLCLWTAQRREKIASMRWEDVDLENGVWTVSAEDGEKGTGGDLVLPQLALDLIAAQPRIGKNPFVFAATRSKKKKYPHFNSWSQRKKELDEKIDLPHWTIHDLRRTARSLMARAGVPDHIAERTLGHKQAGIQAIYNRHEYREEKAKALFLLSIEIAEILDPGQKVVAFPR